MRDMHSAQCTVHSAQCTGFIDTINQIVHIHYSSLSEVCSAAVSD